MRTSEYTAAIIGVGQIGGSLALALKQARLFKKIGGYDRDPKRLKLAQSFLDLGWENREQAMQESDVIILATPVQSILRDLQFGMENYPEKLYTDVGSSKRPMMALVKQYDQVRYIGGHPLAGSEKKGEAGWDKTLFQNNIYFFCADRNQVTEDVELVRKMIQAVGAIPTSVDPADHDRSVAITSHLPLLLSLSLLDTYAEKSPELQSYVGTGFRSTTRLCGGATEMGKDLLISNRDNILAVLRRFISHLTQFKQYLEKNEEDQLFRKMEELQHLYWREIDRNRKEE